MGNFHLQKTFSVNSYADSSSGSNSEGSSSGGNVRDNLRLEAKQKLDKAVEEIQKSNLPEELKQRMIEHNYDMFAIAEQ